MVHNPLAACPLCWGDDVVAHGDCFGRGCSECNGTGSEDCPRCEAERNQRYYEAECALYGCCASCGESGASFAAFPQEGQLCPCCEEQDRRDSGYYDDDPYEEEEYEPEGYGE